MFLNNLNNDHFTALEKTAVLASLAELEAYIAPKAVSITKEERQKYGSVNEQNKLVVNKVNDYRTNQPALSTPDVNWAEFTEDLISREFTESLINRLKSMVEGLENKKILHDFDNYTAALKDYGYSQYQAGSNKPGYQIKVDEVGQFFNRKGKTGPASPSEE